MTIAFQHCLLDRFSDFDKYTDLKPIFDFIFPKTTLTKNGDS